MGDSLYSWHVSTPAGGSPAGPPCGGRDHASDTLPELVLWNFVIQCYRPRRGRKRPRRWAPRRAFFFLIQVLDKSLGVGYQPFRGYYPVSLFRGRTGHGEPASRWPRPEYSVKRRSPNPTASKDGPIHLAPMESGVFGKLSSLVAHCAETRYDDGEPRRPGWFTIKTLGAAWCVQVKDPDSACQMTTTAATLDDALVLADVLLGSDEAPWEPDPFLKAQEARKKK